MKRVISIILTVLMIVSMLSIFAFAKTVSGTCGENVNWSLDTETGTLTISGTGDMDSYFIQSSSGINNASTPLIQNHGTNTYDYTDYVKRIVIEDGITGIGDYFFFGCEAESIVIPDSVRKISKLAFCNDQFFGNESPGVFKAAYYFMSIKDVYLPDITNWNEVELSDRYSSPCMQAQNIYVDGVLIDENTDYIIPDGITEINTSVFAGFDMKSVEIPSGVTTIKKDAFNKCEALTTVTLPADVTSIGDSAFRYCAALTDVYYDSTESDFLKITIGTNNDSFKNATKHYGHNITGGGSMTGGGSNVGNSVTGTAGANATYSFDPSTAVLTITGTGTLWGPGLEAAKRPLVKEVVIEGLTSISANIFSGAHFTSLEKVTLPEGLTSLGKGAFTDCKKLSEINLPTTLTTIGELCFYNCKALTKIDIPANVTSIGNSAFLGVVASDINFAGTRAMWDAVTIGTENARLSFVACSDDVRTILDKATKGDGAWIFNEANETLYFAGNTNFIKSYAEGAEMVPAEIAVKVKYIDIDETLGGFGAYTFSNMTNVISVTGGENIRYVGNYAFKNCSNLKSVSFTNAQYFGGIPYGLFANCTSLETVELSDSIKYFYGASFQGCSSLKEITIPAGAKAVGEYTFRNCTALETITLHEGITSFGAGAIQGCTSLKTINFPSTLKTIGQYAFYNVPSTLTVNFGGTQSQWNTVYVREGNTTLNSLTVNCK